MKARKITRILSTILSLAICATIFSSCNADKREEKYKEAYELLSSRNYEAAYALFVELGDYKDAAKEAEYFRYIPAGYYVEYVDGEETGTITYTVTFNEQNLPATINKKYNDGFEHTCNITYNAFGLMARRVCSNTDGETTCYVATYDANGNLLNETLTDVDGSVSKFDYTYNEKNQCVGLITTNAPDYYLSYESTYDADGREIRIVCEHESGVDVEEMTYNAAGDILKDTWLENGEVYSTYDYSYDEKGRLVEMTFTIAGEATSYRKTISYNEKDQKTTEHAVHTDEYEYTYNYEYDEHGNAVKTTYDEKGSEGYEYSDVTDTTYKLVYLPYEYTEDEWTDLCDATLCWGIKHF